MATTEELIIKLTADNNDLKKKLSESNKSVTDFSSHISKMGGLIAASFTGAAIGAFARQAYLASEQQEKANRRLLSSLQGNTKAFEELVKQANKLQSTTGVADDAIMQIQQLGAIAGKSTDEIKKITEASVQLAAKTGQDLQSAYMMLNGTLTGSAGRLGRVDKDFAALTETQLKNGEAIDIVLDKYKGFAEKSVSDLELLTANWDEFKESAGSALGKVINPLLKATSDYLTDINSKQGFFQKLVTTTSSLAGPAAAANVSAYFDAKNSTISSREVMMRNMPLYKQTQEEEARINKAKIALDQLKQSTADYIEEKKKEQKIHVSVTSALDEYINSMEEAYRKQSELAQFDVPVPTKGAMNAGVTLMTPKGITGKGGDASKLAARNQTEFGDAVNKTNSELEQQIQSISQMTGIMAGFGDVAASAFGEQSAAAKAFAIGQVIASAAMGIMGTWAGYAKFGPWGTALAVAQTAMIAGVAATQIGNIAGAFANGGIVGGGSFSGDKMTARVNSGEMILNGNQQRELWAMANGYGQKQQIEVVGYISGDVIRLANKRSEYINGRKA